MRRRRRAALLPPDRGLQARMVLALLLPPLVTFGGVAATIVFLPDWISFGIVVVVLAGIGTSVFASDESERLPRPAVSAHQRPELHAIVDRLCVMADLRKPEVVIEYEQHANSWIEAPSRRAPARLHLTAELVRLLPPDELEAVIAHELCHVAHHDARVVAVAGSAGDVLLKGAASVPLFQWGGAAVAAVLGWISRLGTLALARHRELVADAGSAALTGRPAALACALRRVSGELRLVPGVDLRATARRDVLHLVPVGLERFRHGWLRTHPSLDERIARLERLEQALHTTRR
jgi:heat shock protein HtpX